jgi:hypothetical protein
MMPAHPPEIKRSSAVFVYLVVIIALQLFLLVVSLEAFQDDDAALAWPAAALSTGLFATTLAFARLLRRD